MSKISRYFRGVAEQAKMVRWPKRKELLRAVGIVLIVVSVAAIALTLSDGIVGGLLKALDNQFASSSSSSESTAGLVDAFTTLL